MNLINFLFVLSDLIAAFWRLILCLSVVYELALIFLLFQVGIIIIYVYYGKLVRMILLLYVFQVPCALHSYSTVYVSSLFVNPLNNT